MYNYQQVKQRSVCTLHKALVMARTARFIVQSLQKLNSNEIFTVSVMTAPIAASNIVKCGT